MVPSFLSNYTRTIESLFHLRCGGLGLWKGYASTPIGATSYEGMHHSIEPTTQLRACALARDTSVQTTHSFVRSPEPFPFRRLPRELRLYILGYIHLGRHNRYHESDDLLRIQDGKIINANVPFEFLGNKCCRKCTETLIDCCCPSARAAYSTTCTCRRLPSGLFFVDREMRQDAMAVFLR